MTREQKIKKSNDARRDYWRNPAMHRNRARARKTRILIDRARIEALQELKQLVQA